MHATLTVHSLFSPASRDHAPDGLQNLDDESLGNAAQVVDSTELLRGHKAVAIKHNGAIYRLQATKLGKLILTK
ncbi:MAG: hemin uptake protein HemP [Burkholderiaceae bacterium]